MKLSDISIVESVTTGGFYQHITSNGVGGGMGVRGTIRLVVDIITDEQICFFTNPICQKL